MITKPMLFVCGMHEGCRELRTKDGLSVWGYEVKIIALGMTIKGRLPDDVQHANRLRRELEKSQLVNVEATLSEYQGRIGFVLDSVEPVTAQAEPKKVSA